MPTRKSKQQKRRTLSMRPVEFQRLKNLSRATGESMAAVVERLVRAEADRHGVPTPSRIEHLEHKPVADLGSYEGGHFTW